MAMQGAPGCVAVLAALVAAAAAPCRAVDGASADVPGWLYPLNPPSAGTTPHAAPARRVRIPGVATSFPEAELGDLFFAPDWRPASHAPMPEIVARGRPPDVYACGYCHSPSGQGRPENAALAGLPAAYIIRQVEDFRSGARRGAWPGHYLPSELMAGVAQHASGDEIAVAAGYFERQTLKARAIVRERARVPRLRVIGWVYAADPSGGEEPLGERLLETAPDPVRHERRDDAMRYVVYAPPGSVARGGAIARTGGGVTAACSSCHGQGLKGVGLVPPLAGRSPTYLLRQLLAFQTGARRGPGGGPMQPVVAALAIGQMIDVAAYAASLPP